jgi:hypothetical protein
MPRSTPCTGLEIGGRHVGYVRPELAEKLVEKAPDSLCRTGPRG